MKKIENIDKRIDYISEELLRWEKINKRLANIEDQLELLYNDLAHRKNRLDKEHKDFKSIEKMSSSALFNTLLGDQSNKLEKEKKEYLQAVLEYNEVANEIELYTYEKKVLNEKLFDNKALLKNLDYYLEVKEKALILNKKGDVEKIKHLNKELNQLEKFRRELKQAKIVTDRVYIEISKALKTLKEAVQSEFFKRQKKSRLSYEKGKYLDSATKEAARINLFLKKLDKELSDVYVRYSFISIHKFENFVHTYFDSMIDDWIRENRMKNALKCLQRAVDETQRIQSRINFDLKTTIESIDAKKEEKREIVKSS